MKLHIRHTTDYRYTEPLRYALQTLWLTPQSSPAQTVNFWSVGAPEKLFAQKDAFGNTIQSYTFVGNVLDNHITGSASNNWLLGGDGADTLDGGVGNDVLFGQAGTDSFVIRAGEGSEIIGDFTVGSDALRLLGYAAVQDFAALQAVARQVGADLAFELAPGETLLLQGMTLSTFLAADVIFQM